VTPAPVVLFLVPVAFLVLVVFLVREVFVAGFGFVTRDTAVLRLRSGEVETSLKLRGFEWPVDARVATILTVCSGYDLCLAVNIGVSKWSRRVPSLQSRLGKSSTARVVQTKQERECTPFMKTVRS